MTEDLFTGFISPPNSARPRVWWHWMNGNITKEGIRKDLEWMKRVGIGGLQNFDGALETPQVVEERLVYMTPRWQDAFRYAIKLADELGLEFAIASSPGWSETGGPWVKPEDGMKKLVWSEAHLAHHFRSGDAIKGIKLTAPPAVAGPFQTIPMIARVSGEEVAGPRYYQDVAVVAYPTPRALWQNPRPVAITTSAPLVDVQAWAAQDQTRPITLPVSAGQPAWILYDYGAAERFRALTLAPHVTLSLKSSLSFVVESSADGKRFEHVAELLGDWHLHRLTVSFATVTARYLRLSIALAPPTNWVGFEFAANSPGAQMPPRYTQEINQVRLREIKFYSGARIHHFEDKAGFSIAANYYGLESPPNEADEAIDPRHTIELTDKMSADGMLHWAPPAGEWTVLRLGYSLTGRTNHPASAEATGLEVDKLDKRAVKAYLETYLGNFEKTVGDDWMGRRGIRAFLTDSIESAGQNWTNAMLEEFRARQGYDLTPWFPALTGVIVGDAARTDRFLWDFRRTLIDLISDAHYGQIAESVHARGMLYYSESLEGIPTATLGDDLDMRVPADIPMAAIWTSYKLDERAGIINHLIDMMGAASVAHVFGKRFVGCESMSSANEPWAFSPRSLKPFMDLAFVLGVNRPIIHTSVHQPVEKRPGISLGCYGQQFTRHETWAEMAAPWVTYLSRCSYLLQQGVFVAEIAWFYGEEGSAANLVSRVTLADLPSRYGFDLISPNMLLKQLSACDGRLVSPAGASYRLLFLGGSSAQMTLPVLRKIKQLADHGIAIAGPKSVGSPSLRDEGQEEEYQRLVADLWGSGQIVESRDPEAVLRSLSLAPDFECAPLQPDTHVRFLHRMLSDGEVYFLTNRNAHAEKIEARFRVTGRRPELWHADRGLREAVSWRVEAGRTVVPLDLASYQSVFVVFRAPTSKTAEEIPARTESPIIRLEGNWDLSFEPSRGAPDQMQSGALGSWTQSPECGIKYFSGIGTYCKTFDLGTDALEAGARVLLDLGEVHELAEVTLNGQFVGTAWYEPFRLDVTEAIQRGTNAIQIRVANLWVNRLIGDQQPGSTAVAFTVTPTYRPDAPLRPSGLMGPVTLLRRDSGI